jgi:hypothetical protein
MHTGSCIGFTLMHMGSWPSTHRINQITLIQSKMNQVTFVSPLSNLAGARMGLRLLILTSQTVSEASLDATLCFSILQNT